MIDLFLKQLSNGDIQWLKQNGHTENIQTGGVLIEQARSPDFLYLIISGEFMGSISQNQGGRLGRVFAALEDDQDLEQEIARFSPGEVMGTVSTVELTPAKMTIRATENSSLLAIPHPLLQQQITQDLGFASRFYRGIATLLSERFGRLVQYFLRQHKKQIPPLEDVPLIFGELRDSDVDWMLNVGRLTQISAQEVLILNGEQMENLYILLQGTIAVLVKEEQPNKLISLFAALERDEQTDESLATEIIRLNRGEILGEAIALNDPMSNYTLRALENCSLLTIPGQHLLVKLQQDVGIAARFYRVVSMLISGRLQGLISRLGYGRSPYQVGQTLDTQATYEDEIDLEIMDNLTLGGARFDWMLKRLKVS
ncbi:cyclic nucleotide-binding domain-containing protein [Chrysosporum bergii ANA360D]|jgi:bacteriocin-type transport-associated protein|uniref:Cyclic nucleotide-binding domain-containing protein n=1 Tax=Chrysosporum bergii ANA360D TaxID=617107 RepID=A0AA43KAU1_9CYAN|nr:cyclic nucleotide-binding domain-containing protein [Chrysosporum bergii]MDH6059592.1 cyclic nucleotide-binding domain-containing protein [Chrysosporum bergii ANA360D]